MPQIRNKNSNILFNSSGMAGFFWYSILAPFGARHEKMRVRFVTGADSSLFLNACALVSSFTTHARNARIQVCDFGLSAGQSAFLDSLGLLLPMPESLRGYDHPFYRKGAVYDYVAPDGFDALVWLDADMILNASVEDEITAIVQRLSDERKVAAACHDINGMTLGDFISHWTPIRSDVAIFKSRLEQNPDLLDAKYLNSAMIILREEEIAKKWRDETLQWPITFLFEQNAFNRTVWMNGGALILDANIWNLNAEMAGNDQSPKPTASARVLHSSGTPETRRTCNMTIRCQGESMKAPLRTFWRRDLLELHTRYINEFFATNAESVTGSGLLAEDEHKLS